MSSTEDGFGRGITGQPEEAVPEQRSRTSLSPLRDAEDLKSYSDREATVLRILELEEKTDWLRKWVPEGRRVPLVLLVAAVWAFVAKVFLGMEWGVIAKFLLGLGFVLAYVEFVLWQYSKRIEGWEREIESASRIPSGPRPKSLTAELDPYAEG